MMYTMTAKIALAHINEFFDYYDRWKKENDEIILKG